MKRWKRFVWTLATLILLAVVTAALLLWSGVLEDRLRRLVERRATKALGTEVVVERLRLGILPPSVRLDHLRLRRRGNRGSELAVTADTTTVHAGFLTWIGLRRGPLQIAIERPHVSLALAEGHPLGLQDGGGDTLAAVEVLPRGSSLKVRDATLDLDMSGGARLHLEGGQANLLVGDRPASISGHGTIATGTAQGLAGSWSKLGAEAEFDLSAGGLRLDPVSIRAEGLALTGRLAVALGEAPRLTGEARLGIEMVALTRFLPPAAAPGGRLEARLQGTWGSDGPRLRGDLNGGALRIFGLTIDSLRSDLELGESLKATGIKAHLLGGEATGALEADWRRPERTTQIDASIDGVDLAQLLGLAGWNGPAVSGTVHYRGRHVLDARGLPGLSGSGVFDAVGHYVLSKGAPLPLEVTSTLATEGATVRLTGGTIRAGSVRGNFSGTVAEGEGIRLRLRGATGDIGEILPLFNPPAKPKPQPKSPAPAPSGAGPPAAAAGGMRPVRLVAWHPDPSGLSPLEAIVRALGGTWEWDGDLQYRRGRLSFEGTLSGRDLTYRETPIGALTSRILYRNDILTIREATLHPPDGGEVGIGGRVDFGVEAAVNLDIVATDCPIAPALSIAGASWPAEGRFSARVGVGGRPGAPAAHATLETGKVRLGDLRFDRVQGEILATPDLIEVRSLVVSTGPGVLSVEGRLPYHAGAEGEPVDAGTSEPGLTAVGHDLDLPLWSRTAADLGLSGTFDVEGNLTGSLADPGGSLTLRSPQLRAQGADVGPIEGEVRLASGALALTFRVPERNTVLEGTVHLTPGWPADLRAAFSGSEGRIRPVIGALEEVRVMLTGEVEIHGPLRDPLHLRARAVLSSLEAGVAGVTVDAQAPVVLSLEDGRLGLDPLVLAGDGTRIEMSGGLAATGQRGLDLSAHGSFDLRLLRPLLKNLQATGRGEVELRVTGTLDDPDLRGSLVVVGDAIRYPDLPFPINNLKAHGTFEASGMTIDTLSFEAGGGPVEGTGRVGIGAVPGRHTGLAIRDVDLRLHGKNVKSEFPKGFVSVADLDLTFRLDSEGARLEGTIGLVKGVYSRSLRVNSAIVRGGTGLDLLPQSPLPDLVATLGINLLIRADGDVWLRNDLGNLEGSGELKVTGTAARPSVAGRITATEGGALRFRGVRYRVDRGTVDFADPVAINPIFDVQATTTVKEYQVTLHVEGTADDFKYELTSSPALPQQEIVALLLTGRTLGQVAGTSGNLGEETAAAYLGGMFNEELSGRVAGWAGLDVLAIDPFQTSAQGDPTTRVTLAKQVTPDLMLTYSSDLGSAQGSIYELDYSLSRDIILTSLRDRTGSLGADLGYILRGKPPSLPGLENRARAHQGDRRIGAVRIEGHPHFEERRVLARLRLKPGRVRSRAAVNDGVDRLLRFYQKRDFLMAEVDVVEAPGGSGTVDLTVRARSGPRIVIDIEGIGGREGVRQRLAPYWQKGIFLEDIVEAARLRLMALEHDRGFQSAEVTAKVLLNDAEEFRVLYTVRHGPRVRAGEVRVVGTRQISEAEILKVVRTRPAGSFRRGLVRDSKLRDDLEAVRRLYLARGFARVAIAAPEVWIDASGERASVVLHVEEGPLVVLGGVRFEGAASISPGRLEAAAALRRGVPYVSEEIAAALVRVRRAYDASGYYDVRVESKIEPAGANGGAEAVDVVFSILEGKRQIVRDVDVGGNLITNEDVIRRALVVKPGDPLSRANLLESQRRLYQRGIFDAVSLEPAPPADPATATAPTGATTVGPATATAADSTGPTETPARPVQVSVRETAPLSQVFGIGYDSVEKTRVRYDINHRNVFGSGRSLGLHTRASELEQNASLLYRELGIFGGRYDGLATAFWQNERRPAFDVRTIGAAVQISRQTTRATRNLYRYTLRDVDLSQASADFEGSTLRLSGLAASVVHDTRDSAFQPLRGHYLSGEVQYYGHGLGSEADFSKGFAQAYFFKEVLPNTVWAQAVRAGVAVTLGASHRDPSSTGDMVSGLPPSERFFAGGDTTLRGFRRDRVGPLDDTGDPIGGEGVFVLNEELRFPIYRSFQGAVFYDAGNVYRTARDYSLRHLRQVLGAGLRIATPIGPFRFEYGSVIDPRPDESRGQFIISIGQAF